jgi:hypothetical protein
MKGKGGVLMSKYKVGDELIIIESPTEEKKKLKDMIELKIEEDYARLSWAVKIVKVEYEQPNVTLTYRNLYGEENKVFAVCKDIANFSEEKVLEKALLKAFLSEIEDVSVIKNARGEKLHTLY